MTKHRNTFTALAAPFAAGEVKARPHGNRQLSYVTARTVMNRLDSVLGPENWWDDYQPLEKSVICRLSIRLPDGQVLTKADAGGYAGMADAGDDDKSGYSDAFKRAAVKFGVGRYLYRDGVAELTGSPSSAAQIPAGVSAPEPAVRSPAPTPVVAGSQDAQGRGGPRVYGQARAQPRENKRPTTGEDLHYFCRHNTIDPNLTNWVCNGFEPQGFPAKLVDWTPDEVRQAWPSIREHLETVKQAKLRTKEQVA
jgi:hypothetical protein